MLSATVLVPSHDHGPTLRFSVASALAQTVAEIEVLVVGDGVPDVTRELMAELCARDERVRFLDHPKGPRHGEIHRHAALVEARGRIVCYLSDDDLWLPHHLATMEALLSDADFANTLPVSIREHDVLRPLAVDLGLPEYRDLLLSGKNRVPLSCGGHTLALYRTLPHGWRTTPDDVATDLYMWQQLLSVPGVRAASGPTPTVLHFPSSARPGWSAEARAAELERWSSLLTDAAAQRDYYERVLGAVVPGWARTKAATKWQRRLERHRGEEGSA